MSAQERLAAAQAIANGEDEEYLTRYPGVRDANLAYARDLLAADPALAQAIEDGTELALLREALPVGWADPLITFQFYRFEAEMSWSVGVQDCDAPEDAMGLAHRSGYGPTLAEAARACREALEARKGPEGGA